MIASRREEIITISTPLHHRFRYRPIAALTWPVKLYMQPKVGEVISWTVTAHPCAVVTDTAPGKTKTRSLIVDRPERWHKSEKYEFYYLWGWVDCPMERTD